ALAFLVVDHGHLAFSWDPFHAPFPAQGLMLIPQAWSLGTELSFYLVAPFILRSSWRIVFFVFVASIALRVGLFSAGLYYDPFSYRFFPAELMWFLLGYGCYVVYRHVSRWVPTSWFHALLVL